MRASLRKRSRLALGPKPRAAVAGGIVAGLLLGAGLAWGGDAPAGSSVEARAVNAAKQAAAQAQARAQAMNTMAGVPRAATAKPAVAVKPATPAKAAPAVKPAPGVPAVTVAKAAVPAKVPTIKAAPAAKPATPVKTVVPAKPSVPAKAASPAKIPPGPARPSLAGAKPQVAAVTASVRPGMTTVPAPAAHLDDQVTYQYNALGRRDPFLPLLGGTEYVPIDAPPDVGGIKVVGIVWGTQDRFAIVEDARGNSSVLRAGDKVMNGVVESLKRDGVVVSITADGQSQSVTIPLTRKGESNANR